ncbi:MAG: DUF1302 family protein, partial [Parvibaculum sp.]
MITRKGGSHLPAWIAGAALAALTAAGPAEAVEYNIGDVSLSVDSIASMGVTVRASGQDCMYVSVLNGGCPDGKGQSANINTDDGNINFEQWDVASAPVKIVSEFE